MEVPSSPTPFSEEPKVKVYSEMGIPQWWYISIGLLLLVIMIVGGLQIVRLYLSPTPVNIIKAVPSSEPSQSSQMLLNDPKKSTYVPQSGDSYTRQVVVVEQVIIPNSIYVVKTQDGVRMRIAIHSQTMISKPGEVKTRADGTIHVAMQTDPKISNMIGQSSKISITYWEKDWIKSNEIPLLEIIYLD